MRPFEYWLLLGMVMIAPHVSKRYADICAGFYLLVALSCLAVVFAEKL